MDETELKEAVKGLLRTPLYLVLRYFVYFIWAAVASVAFLGLAGLIRLAWIQYLLLFLGIYLLFYLGCKVLCVERPLFYLGNPKLYTLQRLRKTLEKVGEKLEKE